MGHLVSGLNRFSAPPPQSKLMVLSLNGGGEGNFELSVKKGFKAF